MKGFSDRLNETKEYYFSKKLKEVHELIAAGKPIIQLGIGSPDGMPAPEVIQAMEESIHEVNSHGYQPYQGIAPLRKKMAEFYWEQYCVKLNPDIEILPLIGSKEGIMHICMTFLNAGDHVLVPNPGYPTYSSVARLLFAEPILYSLKDINGYWPDFDELEKLDLSKVKLMFANYPHMPTGARADLELFKKLVDFCKKHQIVLIHDNPYSHILENEPKSIFQIQEAKEIALELNSLSKSANMAGWRVGMVSGQETWIRAIATVKSNMDSGMLKGIQEGAIQAFALGQDWYRCLNQIYDLRKQLVFQLIEKLGWSSNPDSAGLFVWAKLPDTITSAEACDYLLYEKNIFATPGPVFGSEGEGYVRFSLCTKEGKIKEAIQRI